MKHRNWIFLSGFIWFSIGLWLLYKGLRLISEAVIQPGSLSVKLEPVFGNAQQAGAFLVGIGLLVGLLKGRFVLIKTVRKVVSRICSLPLPIRLKDAYSRSYWILLGSMFALGMAFRFLPLPVDVRGTIDVAIGSALIQGALFYFKEAIYGTGFPAQSR